LKRRFPPAIEAAARAVAAQPVHVRAPDAGEFRLVLPTPPSVNRYWRVPKALGRPILSAEAREYRLRVQSIARGQGAFQPFTGPVAVSIVWTRERRSGDLDGRLKVVLDCLQGIAYDDDAQIVELHARRRDRDAGEPGLEIVVRPAA